VTSPERRVVAERGGRRLVIVPHLSPGIGDLITDSQSARLIPDVEVESFQNGLAIEHLLTTFIFKNIHAFKS
jgi:hypothetical protein